MKKTTPQVVEPEEIPEVADYMQAKRDLDDFWEHYQGMREELEELVTRYNATLEAADKAVRGKKVTCGPFELYQQVMNLDETALYDAVGREEFLKLGGSIEMVPRYKLNKETFISYVAQNKVPQEVAERVVSLDPRYRAPKKIILR